MNLKPHSKLQLEFLYGKLSQAQVNAFNKWLRLQSQAAKETSKSTILKEQLLSRYPNIQFMVNAWEKCEADPVFRVWMNGFEKGFSS